MDKPVDENASPQLTLPTTRYQCRGCNAQRRQPGGPPANWVSVRLHKKVVPPDTKNFSAYALVCSRACLKTVSSGWLGLRHQPVAGDLEGLVQSEVVPDINDPGTLAHSQKR